MYDRQKQTSTREDIPLQKLQHRVGFLINQQDLTDGIQRPKTNQIKIQYFQAISTSFTPGINVWKGLNKTSYMLKNETTSSQSFMKISVFSSTFKVCRFSFFRSPGKGTKNISEEMEKLCVNKLSLHLRKAIGIKFDPSLDRKCLRHITPIANQVRKNIQIKENCNLSNAQVKKYSEI